MGWSRLFASPDQRGRLLFERGRYAEAATSFRNPMWRGAALMRAGDFKTAADTFGGLDTAESAYDEGNARVMLGQYQPAIDRYDRALELRPDFAEAKANREIARLRLAAIDTGGADAGDQREGADQIVYDKNAKKGEGQDTEVAGAPMSDADIRALWLKRVETRPADFLRARFAAQLQAEPAAGAPP
jgi:Ca-activated chloride channel family protein